ncbi:MAG: alpha/beta fold hydrolase [Thermodesulfobacteriota bacterium]
MIMLYTRLIFFVSTILILAYPAYSSALNNDYGLTTEDQLFSPAKKNAIQKFLEGTRKGAFKGAGNITIRYRYTAKQGNKGGIVIVNGRGESYLKYKETVYDLYRRGFSIYMYDHRGQGLSGRMVQDSQIGHVEDFSYYVRDLKKFYRQIVAKKEKGDIYLLAHSMGGAVAALYLEKDPEDFRAAVLSSPMMEINSGIIPAVVASRLANWLKDAGKLMGWSPTYIPFTGPYEKKPFSENHLTHSPIRYKALITSFYEKRPEIRLGGPSCQWVSEAFKASRIARQNAGRITIPVLLLQAGQDKLVSAAGQRQFCKNLAAGGKSRCEGEGPYIISEAYHELLMEKDRYRIPALTRIIDFFEAH